MIRKFIDRESELDLLNKKYYGKKRQLIILYGRRRVGKTELMRKFSKGKPFIYFLADKRGTTSNAKRFARILAEHFDDITPEVENFDEAFKYLSKRLEKRTVVLIDEFSYLVESDDSIPSVFQLIWDEILDDIDIFLVLAGSSVSMMLEGVLSYKSPLYGRRTGQWKLTPLKFKDVVKFFPAYSFKDKISAFSVLGGIPAYLIQFDPKVDLYTNIEQKVLRKGTFLYEEVEFLLREELRKPSTYMNILEVMASGATRLTDIANKAGMKAKDLPKYMKVLENLELVERYYSVTEKKPMRGLYRIKDKFFQFWFKFVYPNKTELEVGKTKEVLSSIRSSMDEYSSYVFEDVCMQAILEKKLPFKVSRVGTWFYKGDEIDIVGLDPSGPNILLGECKWSRNKIGMSLLNSLQEREGKVKWRNKERDVYFALFSKSGFKKKFLKYAEKYKNVLLFDLQDLERIFVQ